MKKNTRSLFIIIFFFLSFTTQKTLKNLSIKVRYKYHVISVIFFKPTTMHDSFNR